MNKLKFLSLVVIIATVSFITSAEAACFYKDDGFLVTAHKRIDGEKPTTEYWVGRTKRGLPGIKKMLQDPTECIQTVDASFADNGVFELNGKDSFYIYGDCTNIKNINGKYYVVGVTRSPVDKIQRPFIFCLTASGELDRSFGIEGIMNFEIPDKLSGYFDDIELITLASGDQALKVSGKINQFPVVYNLLVFVSLNGLLRELFVDEKYAPTFSATPESRELQQRFR